MNSHVESLIGLEGFGTLVGVLRLFDDGKKYGDPYSWCCTFCTQENNIVYITAVLKAPTPSQWREICRVFYNMGYRKAVFTRIKEDKRIEKEILPPKSYGNKK